MASSCNHIDFAVSASQFIRVTRFGAWEMHFQRNGQIRLGTYPLMLNRTQRSLSGLCDAVRMCEGHSQNSLCDLLEGKVAFEDLSKVVNPAHTERQKEVQCQVNSTSSWNRFQNEERALRWVKTYGDPATSVAEACAVGKYIDTVLQAARAWNNQTTLENTPSIPSPPWKSPESKQFCQTGRTRISFWSAP